MTTKQPASNWVNMLTREDTTSAPDAAKAPAAPKTPKTTKKAPTKAAVAPQKPSASAPAPKAPKAVKPAPKAAPAPIVPVRPAPKRAVSFYLPEDALILTDLAMAAEAAKGRKVSRGEVIEAAIRRAYSKLA